MKTFQLIPKYTRQKSYYRKAVVYEYEDGEKYLQSYETIVAMIDGNGEFHRLWNSYSKTTSNHINDFRMLYGIESIGKQDWLKLKSENEKYLHSRNGMLTPEQSYKCMVFRRLSNQR